MCSDRKAWVRPDAVSTQTKAFLEPFLRGRESIINLPIPHHLGTPVDGPRPLWQLPWTLHRTHRTCCHCISRAIQHLWQYSVPPGCYGNGFSCALNQLYLPKGQLLGHIPELGHQLPDCKECQCLASWDLEDSKHGLRLLQVSPNVFIYPDSTRAYSWLSTPQLSIVQVIELTPLEQPNCQCKGLMAKHHKWSPAELLWVQPTEHFPRSIWFSLGQGQGIYFYYTQLYCPHITSKLNQYYVC